MSRIGIKPITIPQEVTVSIETDKVMVKGPKGQLSIDVPKHIQVGVKDNQVVVKRANNVIQTKAYHGLVRSLIQNMVQGVTQGYSKKLQLVGTGYRAKVQADTLVLTLGFSHPVEHPIPEGIQITTEGDTNVIIQGIDKHAVGQTAANIRDYRPPEPYKGKGIRYADEVIRRKAGKAAKSAA
jgi:large subunit ribosomal protein L6